MSDDKTKRAPQDASRISLREDYEVRYWTERFKVSEVELAKAVAAVGSSAAAVKDHLAKNKK
jgi:hypothetical protein